MNKVYIKEDELEHFGVQGMRWGVRKDRESLSERRLNRLVEKDAQRYAEAKMFYGKTAGTKRKLLKAELDKKKKDIPGYEKKFNQKVEEQDYAKAAKKAVRTRTRIDTTYRARVSVKQFLGITSSLGIAAASAAYFANKQKVDSFVKNQAQRVITQIEFRDLMRNRGG